MKSKKLSYALLGLGTVMFVYLLSMTVLVLKPEVSGKVVELANIAIVFLGSVTSILLTGQSAIDWKAGSHSQFSSTDDKSEKRVLDRREVDIKEDRKVSIEVKRPANGKEDNYEIE